MFSPFDCGDIDSRMKILIHIEKMRFECTKHLMHINNHDRQIKLAPVVGFEPTIRLRRINSHASIGVLQNAHEKCIPQYLMRFERSLPG